MASLTGPIDSLKVETKKRYEYDFYIKQFLQKNTKIKNFEMEMMLTTGLVDYYFGTFCISLQYFGFYQIGMEYYKLYFFEFYLIGFDSR